MCAFNVVNLAAYIPEDKGQLCLEHPRMSKKEGCLEFLHHIPLCMIGLPETKKQWEDAKLIRPLLLLTWLTLPRGSGIISLRACELRCVPRG